MHTTALLQPGATDAAPIAPAQHLLVIANETLAGTALVEEVARLVAHDGEVLVVCPVLVGRSHYWTSDLSAGIEQARARLHGSLESLRARAIASEGVVGDGHPLLAIEDALRTFPCDRILIVTQPPERSVWLERRLVARARARFTPPVSHAIG